MTPRPAAPSHTASATLDPQASSTARPRVAMALYGDLTFDSRVRREAGTLARAGYDVVVVCIADEPGGSDLAAGVTVVVRPPLGSGVLPGSTSPFLAVQPGRIGAFRGRSRWLVSYIRVLRSWGRLAVSAAGPVDVWHAHDLTGLAAISPHLKRGVPLIYDSHEIFLETNNVVRLPGLLRHLLEAYERRLVARTSAVITVNDEIARILQTRYRPARTAVVHNCPERVPSPRDGSSPIRAAAGVPPSARMVLYHGGLIHGRGIEGLLEAMLVEGLTDVHVVLMGYGEMRSDLDELARSGRWQGRLHVMKPVPPSDLLRWISGADVGAMPNPGGTRNDYYSAPNKLFECIAAGVPVVASDFPTFRRIIVENPGGPLGAVCDPTRVEEIARALQSVLSLNDADTSALRARCRRAASEMWSWDVEGGKLLSIYTQIAPLERLHDQPTGGH